MMGPLATPFTECFQDQLRDTQGPMQNETASPESLVQNLARMSRCRRHSISQTCSPSEGPVLSHTQAAGPPGVENGPTAWW